MNHPRQKMQFLAAILLWLQVFVAGHSSFSSATEKLQEQVAPVAQDNYLIDRDRGLVKLDGSVRLEPDGVYSETEIIAPWHQIVGGQVGSGLQKQFQTRLTNYGQPLFLLRSRLARGDWSEANTAATEIESWLTESDLTTQSLVRFARFHTKLATGNPEQAVIPLLELCDNWTGPPDLKDSLLKDLCSDIDVENAVTNLLVPVWDNQLRAADAWTAIQKEISATELPHRAGWYVYGASLGIAAGDLAGAEELLKSWNTTSAADKVWVEILVGSLAVAQDQLVLAETELANLLESKQDEFSPLQIATAKWWTGVCRYRQNLPLSAQSSFHEMMAVAAANEKQWPSISETALEVAQSLADSQNWERESFLIDRELQLLRSRNLRYNLPIRR